MIDKIKIGDMFTYSDLKNIYMITHLDLISKNIQAMYIGHSEKGKYTLKSIPYVMSPVAAMIFCKKGEVEMEITQAERESQYEIPHILDKRYPKIVFYKFNGDPFLMVKNAHQGSRMYNMISLSNPGNNFILPESRMNDYELAPCNTTLKIKS
jgi:hypothetical protein